MKYCKLFLCFILLIISFTCAAKQNIIVTQGIRGQVRAVERNLMPGPGQKQERPRGIKRNVLIYEVLKANEVEGQGPLYSTIPARLIKQVPTDAEGFFQCELKAGRYSVFTQEEDHQFFSALSNERGELSPVEVLPDSVVTYNILINYKAVY